MATAMPARHAIAGQRNLRAVPMAFAAAALIAGLWSGLWRLGIVLPGGQPQFTDMHGALLISGFFGTLISLERAVALGGRWTYLAPACSAAGALGLLSPMTAAAAPLLFIAASVILTLVSLAVVNRQPLLITVVMTIAAASWGIGTAIWLTGNTMPLVTGWWLSFLVLTIAAERLELSRVFAPSPAAQVAFTVAVGLVFAGTMRGELNGGVAPLLGPGLIACSVWLLVHDAARRTVMHPGQIRFCSAAMLAGYVWLGVCGLLLLAFPPQTTAFGYDAAVHTIAIGFVLSMVFGHALIILPAVLKLSLRYSAALYFPLALLHGSLAVRIASDILEWPGSRAFSGVLTIVALALFAATLVLASARKRHV